MFGISTPSGRDLRVGSRGTRRPGTVAALGVLTHLALRSEGLALAPGTIPGSSSRSDSARPERARRCGVSRSTAWSRTRLVHDLRVDDLVVRGRVCGAVTRRAARAGRADDWVACS